MHHQKTKTATTQAQQQQQEEEDPEDFHWSEFEELVPSKCQVPGSEWNRIMNEALDVYRRTFLGEDSLEQPVHKIIQRFMDGHQKILVNLRVLPQREKCGVAATAIVCVLVDSPHMFHLDYLCVNSEYRGNGIGSVFMTQYVIPHMNQHYGKHLSLECEQRLMRWYSKLGATTLQDVYPSRLGNLPAQYHLMCFLSTKNGDVTGGHDSDEELISHSEALQALFEVRRRFHAMSDYELLEVVNDSNDSDERAVVVSPMSDHETSSSCSTPPQMVYRWIMDSTI